MTENGVGAQFTFGTIPKMKTDPILRNGKMTDVR